MAGEAALQQSRAADPKQDSSKRRARQHAQDAFEHAYVKDALDRAGGSVTEAARLAGVSRQFLQRLVKKHALR